MGLSFVIAHESIFYHHLDEVVMFSQLINQMFPSKHENSVQLQQFPHSCHHVVKKNLRWHIHEDEIRFFAHFNGSVSRRHSQSGGCIQRTGYQSFFQTHFTYNACQVHDHWLQSAKKINHFVDWFIFPIEFWTD